MTTPGGDSTDVCGAEDAPMAEADPLEVSVELVESGCGSTEELGGRVGDVHRGPRERGGLAAAREGVRAEPRVDVSTRERAVEDLHGAVRLAQAHERAADLRYVWFASLLDGRHAGGGRRTCPQGAVRRVPLYIARSKTTQ